MYTYICMYVYECAMYIRIQSIVIHKYCVSFKSLLMLVFRRRVHFYLLQLVINAFPHLLLIHFVNVLSLLPEKVRNNYNSKSTSEHGDSTERTDVKSAVSQSFSLIYVAFVNLRYILTFINSIQTYICV